ncbi:hypothetical protein ACJX0J_009007, partial [Zea mays]
NFFNHYFYLGTILSCFQKILKLDHAAFSDVFGFGVLKRWILEEHASCDQDPILLLIYMFLVKKILAIFNGVFMTYGIERVTHLYFNKAPLSTDLLVTYTHTTTELIHFD